MKNSIIHLIRFAKVKGAIMSVRDDEDWLERNCVNEKMLLDAINSVDECAISFKEIREVNGLKTSYPLGIAYITNGLDANELVSDYTETEFMQAWAEQYYKDNA